MDTHTHHMPGTAVLIAIGVTLVAAVATIALLGGRDVVEYAPGTPEATAQAYIQALFDRDYEAADALLSPAARARCPSSEIELDDTHTGVATFERVRRYENRVVIEILLAGARFEPGPFPIDTDQIETELTLRQLDGEWRIVAGDWPFDRCAWR